MNPHNPGPDCYCYECEHDIWSDDPFNASADINLWKGLFFAFLIELVVMAFIILAFNLPEWIYG